MELSDILKRVKKDFFKQGKQFLVVYGGDAGEMQKFCERFSMETGYFAYPLLKRADDERAYFVDFRKFSQEVNQGV